MNEPGTIRRQEDNGLSDLVRCSRTARWRLARQFVPVSSEELVVEEQELVSEMVQ